VCQLHHHSNTTPGQLEVSGGDRGGGFSLGGLGPGNVCVGPKTGRGGTCVTAWGACGVKLGGAMRVVWT
jgi:hypothetical protein